VLAGLFGTVALAFSAALAARRASSDGSGDARPAAGGAVPDAGFRQLDHTADTAIEAWGPTRAACLEAAVRGLVASFADVEGAGARERHPVVVGPGDDADLLVDLLDEVIYLLDARRAVVVGASLRDTEAGAVEGTMELAPVGEVRPAGAVPKAVTYHDLRIGRDADGAWRAHVIIDV
ncbi:MAG: archease, partial [Nitriliruptorales bacterium]